MKRSQKSRRGLCGYRSGPLTADALAEDIFKMCGGGLSFFDAAAPIVTAESLDRSLCFAASRYDKGEDDALSQLSHEQRGI